MRVGRTHHDRMAVPFGENIAGKLSLAREQPLIFHSDERRTNDPGAACALY
jgi:hypothetical protein